MATIYQNGIQYSGSGEPLIYDDMGGATSTTGGVHGLVPAPSAGDNEKFLSGDGSWKSAGEYITKTATGNPIEISDGANAPLVKCVTAITGSQDLHGYDKPWVGGAGKNKFVYPYSASSTTSGGITVTVNSDGSVRFNGTSLGDFYWNFRTNEDKLTLPPGTYTFSANTIPAGCAVYYSGNFLNNGNLSRVVTITEATSYYFFIQIPSRAEAVDFTIKMQIESGQTATTWEPYSNICPITAYTEGEIEVRGKNLFDKSSATQNYRVITLNGELEYSSGAYASDYTAVTPNTVYTMNFVYYSAANFGMAYYDANKVYISGEKQRTQEGDTSFTFTTPNNCKYIRFTIGSDVSINNVQLEKGSTATTYEPYTSTTHTTTFPSAIYRGSEDVVNGEVSGIKLKLTISSGIKLYGNYGDDNAPLFYYDVVGGNVAQYSWRGLPDDNKPLCNIYTATTGSSALDMKDFEIRTQGSNPTNRLYFRDSRFTTESDINSYVANNPLEVVYKCYTPTISSVTPTNLPIKSLSGYNHIESTTGDMEVEYITEAFSPITELVDSQISALQKMMELMLTANREAEMIATQNYTAGDLLIVSGKLYKASSNIANGSTLVINSNVTSTTIAAELAALA